TQKISHHFPFGNESCGAASRHGAGAFQLGGVTTSGFLYFGPPANALALTSMREQRTDVAIFFMTGLAPELPAPADPARANRWDSGLECHSVERLRGPLGRFRSRVQS